jgi:hypothetical protein
MAVWKSFMCFGRLGEMTMEEFRRGAVNRTGRGRHSRLIILAPINGPDINIEKSCRDVYLSELKVRTEDSINHMKLF